MDIETIGAALRRKLGPLPVWAWAILGGAVVYLLRSRGYFSGVLGDGTKSADALQPGQAPTLAPQPLSPLAPGESVYNPNDGTLTTAPGGGGSEGGGVVPTDNSDVTDAIQALTDAVLNNHTDSESPNTASPTTHKPTALQRAKKAVSLGKVGPQNRSRLRKAGYTDAQIDYHLKRHTGLGKPRSVQKKAANTQEHGKNSKSSSKQEPKAGIHTPTSNTHKSRARSNSHVRTATGGRSKAPNTSVAKTGKARTAVATAKSTVRQRPRTAVVTRSAPVSHPKSAAHATAQKKTVAAHAAAPTTHAPSSPPARAVRTPPKPARKKR